jgi:hypothetical protein
LGIGVRGLGIRDWAQSPIPNPHLIIIKINNFIYNKKNIKKYMI